MKRLIANVALSIGIGLTFMPVAEAGEPTSEYFRRANYAGGQVNSYCAAYDAGMSRDRVIESHADFFAHEFPEDFWNFPNTDKGWQVMLMTFMTHDSAITHACPRHSEHLGTAEEWYTIFNHIDMNAAEEKLMEGIY